MVSWRVVIYFCFIVYILDWVNLLVVSCLGVVVLIVVICWIVVCCGVWICCRRDKICVFVVLLFWRSWREVSLWMWIICGLVLIDFRIG